LEDSLTDPDAANPGKQVDQHLLRERIQQIEARGLPKVRQPLRSQRLAEFAEKESRR